MSRKNVISTFAMIGGPPSSQNYVSGDMSTSIVSNVVNTINLDNGSIHIYWTGTAPEGEIIVEARNGNGFPERDQVDNWYQLDFDTITITGNEGNHQLIFNSMPFTEIRLQYGRTSGTGTMTARISAKTVGA